MDNKIEIVSEYGRFSWRVLTADGIEIAHGFAADRLQAAHDAIMWTEARGCTC